MSETLAEIIINEVKSRRMLWDIKHKSYHDRKLVDWEWRKIAENVAETKEAVKTKWKNLRDTFRKELKKVPNSRPEDDAEMAPRYPGTWPHYDAMLFLRPVITPRQTKDNVQTPDLSYTFASEYDKEGAKCKERIDANESDIESSQSFQLNASSNQSVSTSLPSTSGTNEHYDKTRNSKVTFQSKRKLRKELRQLQNSLSGVTVPIDGIKISPSASKRLKLQPTASSENFEKEISEILSKQLSLLRGKSGEDDEDMNFFKSLIPHVKQLPCIHKLNFRSRVQNLLAHELLKIYGSSCRSPSATPRQRSPSSTSSSPTPSPANWRDDEY
ncbi:uncharacterized protein LOC110832767 [Zootermopsis nevadensis]|uniref:MADF domain-containing protein n=1 Tax=Zootermopsis nevadensis TaxID=136037 RepID=A0A067RLD0_ZOONE|nr:uncharacterized protein LOC110832767 [Zootermopsis nevadensis]KDR23843.1 hypothetical protein L798_11034 [Zootermopsis nevadensis]